MFIRLCLLFLFSLQISTIAVSQEPNVTTDSLLQVDGENHEGIMKIYLGRWTPFWKLQEDFNSVTSFGAAFGANLRRDYRLEVKGQVILDPGERELSYKLQDSLIQTSDVTIIHAGFRFLKEKRIQKNTVLDLGAELNVTILSLDEFDEATNESDMNSVYSLGCAFGPGIKRIFSNGFSMGIESYVHLTPYSLNPNMVSSTGFVSNITQVFFSFLLPL